MILHLSYLACDGCAKMCDGSDGNTAGECRRVGRSKGWIQLYASPRVMAVLQHPHRFSPNVSRADLCPDCQLRVR